MDEQNRKENYPLKELPEGISVTSSVLQLERFSTDQKLKEILGDELTGILILPQGGKPRYGAQVSLDNDTPRIYIEETWSTEQYDFFRTANTNIDNNKTYLSIYVSSGNDLENKTKSATSIEVVIEDDQHISSVSIGGTSALGLNTGGIPYIEDLLKIKGLEVFRAEAEKRFDRGDIVAFMSNISFKDAQEETVDASATNERVAGNGLLIKKLRLQNGHLLYGTVLTPPPPHNLFTKVDLKRIN